jgi:hypothetical protein
MERQPRQVHSMDDENPSERNEVADEWANDGAVGAGATVADRRGVEYRGSGIEVTIFLCISLSVYF